MKSSCVAAVMNKLRESEIISSIVFRLETWKLEVRDQVVTLHGVSLDRNHV